MNVTQKASARGGRYWARLCALPAFSFLLNGAGGVSRVQDSSGNWVELSEVQQIVDDAESRIAELQAAPPAPAAVPVLFVSAEQFAHHRDPEGDDSAEAGRYLPTRKTPAGKFTQPLYALAAAPAQAQDDLAAFKAYLQECNDCSIVPDVAGAFNAGWTAGTRAPAQEHATQFACGAVARIRAVDEFGPCLDWFKHWVNFPAGTLLYRHPAPVAQPHHCTARTADGACEECEMHAQAMAEWKAETSCGKPRVAWNCSCAPGHDGTCAVTPAAPAENARELLEALQGIKALGWLKEHSCLNAAGIKAVRKAIAALAAHDKGSAQP